MKTTLLLSLLLFISGLIHAQDPPADTIPDGWKKSGSLGLTTAQTYLNNWAAGGQNSLTFNGLLDYTANLKKGNSTWENSFQVAYGLLLQDFDSRAVKTDDKFDVTSKYGKEATKTWFYTLLGNFKTQMAPGYATVDGLPDYNQKISDAFSPAFLLLSLGMDHKPSERFSAFLSPLTYKMIMVLDDDLARAGAFGVQGEVRDDEGILITPYENIRHEVGGYIRLQYKSDVAANVTLTTKLELFSNYLEDPQNVDVSWETLINMKINDFLSAVLQTHIIYDDNTILNKGVKTRDAEGNPLTYHMGPGTQFKEVFGLGLNFKF